MHPKRMEIEKRLRIIVPVGIALGVLMIVGLWIGYFIVAGWEDSARGKGLMSQPYPWLALALVATVAAPPILFLKVRDYIWLIRHGTEVEGHVKVVSILSHSGSRPVTFGYTVNGADYTIKRDILNSTAENYSSGTPVILIVDPAKPKRVTLLNEV